MDKKLGTYAVLSLWAISAASALIGFLGVMFIESTGTFSVLLASGIGMFFLLGLYSRIFPDPSIASLSAFCLTAVVLVCVINILDAQGRQVDVTSSYYGLILLIPITLLLLYEFKVDVIASFNKSGISLNHGLTYQGRFGQISLTVFIEDNKGKYLIVLLNNQRVILELIDSQFVSSPLFIESLGRKGVICITYDRLKKLLTLVIKDDLGYVLELVECAKTE